MQFSQRDLRSQVKSVAWGRKSAYLKIRKAFWCSMSGNDRLLQCRNFHCSWFHTVLIWLTFDAVHLYTFHHNLMMFDEHTHLCLHWCYAHLCAVQELGRICWGLQCTSVTMSVSSDEAVIDDLGCAAYSSSTDMFSDHVVSVSRHYAQRVWLNQALTCTCIGFMHLSALYRSLAHILLSSSAHQSQGLYHHMKQWLMIWDDQHIHHRLMTFLTLSS